MTVSSGQDRDIVSMNFQEYDCQHETCKDHKAPSLGEVVVEGGVTSFPFLYFFRDETLVLRGQF